MSPEQARGDVVDFRSDIFAFGITLYEMATGRPPFLGVTMRDTFAAIAEAQPLPASTLNPAVPSKLDAILARCLEKSPEDRYGSTGELARELHEMGSSLDDHALPRRSRGRRTALAVAAAAGVGTLIILAYLKWGPSPSPTTEQIARQLTRNPSSVLIDYAAMSPDGKLLAYVKANQLFLQSIDTGESRRLDTPASLIPGGLAWFPDGVRIGVDLGDEQDDRSSIWVVSTLSVAWKKIREDAGIHCVSPDGNQIVFFPSEMALKELWIMGAGGEGPRLLARAEGSGLVGYYASWSPDGKRILYLRQNTSPEGWWSNTLESVDVNGNGRMVALPAQKHFFPGVHATWAPDGRVVFSNTEAPPRASDANFWEFRIDTSTGRPLEAPRRLTNWAGYFFNSLNVSRDAKRLEFVKWRRYSSILVADLLEHGTRIERPRDLTADFSMNFCYGWTSDGESVVFTSNRSGSSDIYRVDHRGGSAEALVSGPDTERLPVLTPDGLSLLYVALLSSGGLYEPEASFRLLRLEISGGEPVQVEEIQPSSEILQCGHHSGSRCVLGETVDDLLVFRELDPVRGRGRELLRVNSRGAQLGNWVLSPDGRSVALSAYHGNSTSLRVISLEGSAETNVEVHGRRLGGVVWNAAGNGFFAVTGPVLVSVDAEGHVRELWRSSETGGIGLLVPSPDGRHLALSAEFRESSVWLMENF
jgi:Tol biopolymer transport system component